MNRPNVFAPWRIRILFATAALATLSWSSPAMATTAPTNNLVMWLRSDTLSLANGANVNSWTDSSGSGHDVVLLPGWTAPTFATNGVNGRPGVFFGVSSSLRVTNNVGGGGTVLLPSGLTFAGAFKTFSSASQPPNGGQAANTLIDDNTGNDTIAFGVDGGVGNFQRYGGGWFTVPSSYPVNDTNTYQGHFLVGMHNSSSGLAQLYADQRFQGSSTISYNGVTGFNIIGDRNGFTTFNGWVGEVLVYSTDLSGPDLQQLQTYLTERWLDIPEPSAMMLLGLGGMLVWRRRHSTS